MAKTKRAASKKTNKKAKDGAKGKSKFAAKREEIARRTKERAVKRKRESSGTKLLAFSGSLFKPRKQCTFDVLPYTVEIDNHPEGAEKGELFWRFPYYIHRNIGAESTSVVCPGTYGDPCPICEDIGRLRKDWDENEQLIRDIKQKERELYNVLDHKSGEVQLLDMPTFFFGADLTDELDEGDDMLSAFWLPDEEGMSLKCKFKEETSKRFGTTYRIQNIEFVERGEAIDEDDLKQVVCLDTLPKVLDYKAIEALYYGYAEGEDPSDYEDKDEDDAPAKPKKGKSKSGGKSKAKGKAKGKKGKCPHGHGWGEADDHDECEGCDVWDDCFDAQE